MKIKYKYKVKSMDKDFHSANEKYQYLQAERKKIQEERLSKPFKIADEPDKFGIIVEKPPCEVGKALDVLSFRLSDDAEIKGLDSVYIGKYEYDDMFYKMLSYTADYKTCSIKKVGCPFLTNCKDCHTKKQLFHLDDDDFYNIVAWYEHSVNTIESCE